MKDNGFHPIFEQEEPFKYYIYCPDMAMIIFEACDKNVMKD